MKRSAQSPSDAALRLGTEAHYVEPELYDKTYARRTHDVERYLELSRELAPGGTILELGAGSGRMTIPLARAGHEVVAVDRMASMLEKLRDRLEDEPREVRERITIKRGDLSKLRLRRRFDLVVAPFNVFMHLYTRPDVERALATCRAHLRPSGKLVFDVSMPDMRAFVRDPARAYTAPPVLDPKTRKKYRYHEQFAYEPESQIQMITAVMRAIDDPTDIRLLPLAHRQFFPAELEALLHYNGFTLQARWGGFERGLVTLDCESQLVVAGLRRGWRKG